MKRKKLISPMLVLVLFSGRIVGQDIPEFRKQQLETMALKNDAQPTDDSYEMDLSIFASHPLNLNTASSDQLVQLHLLNPLQIKDFVSYRELLGLLLSIHELQAIPGWDLETIQRVIPYVRVGPDESVYSGIRERWRGGDASFLIRAGQVLEK